MRAIDYGIQYFGDFSYKNTKSNIVVFNEKIKIEDDDDDSNSVFEPDHHLIEVIFENEEQTIVSFPIDGEKLSSEQWDYIKNSEIIKWKEIPFNFPFTNLPSGDVLIGDSKIYEIEGQFFARVAGKLETVVVSGGISKGKINKKLILLNDILNDKSTSVVVFISDDGVKLERAYQSIDCYANEVLLFIENDFGSNLFGSVMRIKLGENITTNSNFPASQTAKVINSFKLNIDIDSITLTKAILNEIESNKGLLHFIKKRFWLADKIVAMPINLAFETLETGFTEIANAIGNIKFEEPRWRYYNADGTKNKEENLLFFNPVIFEALEDKEKAKAPKTMFSTALKEINNLEKQFNQQLKATKNNKELSNFEKVYRTALKKVKKILKAIKEFLSHPEALIINISKNVLIALNSFLVGLINGVIDIFKGIFDILALLCTAIVGIKNGTSHIAANISSYTGMFVEGLENILDTFINLFSKENLKAFLEFILELHSFIFSLPFLAANFILNADISIPIDKIAYYTGYIIGMIVDIIIGAISTGGAKTVADVLKIIAKQFQEILILGKKAVAATGKAIKNLFDELITIFTNIRHGAKNIKPFLDEILEFLRKFFNDIIKSKVSLLDEIYKKGYDYRKVEMPNGGTITKLYSTKGHKLIAKVEQKFKQLNKLSKTKKNDIVLVNGIISRKYVDDVILHTNFPDSKLKIFLTKNKIDRFNSKLDDIKKIYKYYLEQGHIKFDLHPMLEKRIIKHYEELQKGIKHTNYQWTQTGGLPGVHAEVLSVNEMLHRIENVMNAKGLKMTDEIFTEMIGFNKNLTRETVMIRCGDCNFLTYDIPFIEQFLK